MEQARRPLGGVILIAIYCVVRLTSPCAAAPRRPLGPRPRAAALRSRRSAARAVPRLCVLLVARTAPRVGTARLQLAECGPPRVRRQHCWWTDGAAARAVCCNRVHRDGWDRFTASHGRVGGKCCRATRWPGCGATPLLRACPAREMPRGLWFRWRGFCVPAATFLWRRRLTRDRTGDKGRAAACVPCCTLGAERAVRHSA